MPSKLWLKFTSYERNSHQFLLVFLFEGLEWVEIMECQKLFFYGLEFEGLQVYFLFVEKHLFASGSFYPLQSIMDSWMKILAEVYLLDLAHYFWQDLVAENYPCKTWATTQKLLEVYNLAQVNESNLENNCTEQCTEQNTRKWNELNLCIKIW